jgi:hypothetical protein
MKLEDAISAGHRFILNTWRAGVNDPILLTGYSRGALGVVVLAGRLNIENNVTTPPAKAGFAKLIGV